MALDLFNRSWIVVALTAPVHVELIVLLARASLALESLVYSLRIRVWDSSSSCSLLDGEPVFMDESA